MGFFRGELTFDVVFIMRFNQHMPDKRSQFECGRNLIFDDIRVVTSHIPVSGHFHIKASRTW